MAPKLVDMAKSQEEMAKDACMPCIPCDGSKYPWGLSISLDQESLDKLGVDPKSVEVGDMVHLFSLAKVTSVSSHDTGEGEKNRVELQICFLGTELEDAEDEVDTKPSKRFTGMYKGG